MSSYYYGSHHGHPTPISAAPVSHSHGHHGRNRRAPGRLSMGSQNSQKQYRGTPRSVKEFSESQSISVVRTKFEATRSFDLEDDMDFIPGLCSQFDYDAVSIASSERSSLAGSSPESSPTQQPQTVAPSFSLNSSSPPFVPPAFHGHQSSLKLHQPSATRARNAIPIINPSTGATFSSPPPSVSPARMQQHAIGRRW